MNRQCKVCNKGQLERTILQEHTEDLGGVTATILNAVYEIKCNHCGDTQRGIPDMQGLVRAVAIARALDPARLKGREVRFFRRALDMTQQQFAKTMDLAPETVSRWENDVPGTGAASEKLARHNICGFLYKDVPALNYDSGIIARMAIKNAEPRLIIMQRVRVKHNSDTEDAWDPLPEAA